MLREVHCWPHRAAAGRQLNATYETISTRGKGRVRGYGHTPIAGSLLWQLPSQKQGLSQRLNGIGSGQTGINYDVISRLGRLPNAINGEKREGTGSSPFAQHDDLIMYDVASTLFVYRTRRTTNTKP